MEASNTSRSPLLSKDVVSYEAIKPSTTSETQRHNETVFGWGYVIVLSNFFVMFFVFGLMQSQSLFFVEWQTYFEASAAEVSFLTSLSLLLLGLLSPLGGILATLLGSRLVVMIGGVLVSVGMLLGMFCNTMAQLYVTWGLVVGLGFALIYSPTVAMLGQYFTRYFTTANSIMLTGGAVGMIVGPLVTDFLLEKYGWQGTMLVFSAIMGNLVALGATLRPVRQVKTNQRLRSPGLPSNHLNVFKIVSNLIRNIRYVILLVVFLLLGLVLLAPNVHIIARAEEAGISKSRASWLPTTIGIGNLIGRLSGFLIDKLHLSQDIANVVSFALCTATFVINPFCNNFWSEILYCLAFGLGQGSVIVFTFVLAQILIPESHRAVGVGFMTLCLFSGYTVGIVLVGWLYDIFGGYTIAFYVLGVLAAIGTILVVIVAVLNRRVHQASTTDQHKRGQFNEGIEENVLKQ